MIKRFFIYSLTFALSLCFNTFAEETDGCIEESVEQIKSMDSCFDSVAGDDREALAEQLDSLFHVLIEEGQELYRDLTNTCKSTGIELENDQQAIEFVKESSSGQKILQACRDIFSCLGVPNDELTEENLSLDVLIQKLDEIAQVWRHYRYSKDMEYAYKELDIRERELEFKKDLLSWQKEKTDKELSWKREKYAREMMVHKR
ncbi:hypothetical protein [Chlamydia vaughanii]|uniref:hypothetical protein n=1 Tax=Chlamydia vaughanii TaxID=3112552 RepID=UPI0032B2FFE9